MCENCKILLFETHESTSNSFRRNNLQCPKIDDFNIKSWKARVIEYIDKDVFTSLTYLVFHIEHKVRKYIQMFSTHFFFVD